MATRTTVQWTNTAREQLAKLPGKVRRGILQKASRLAESENPERVYKPLKGPLSNYFRFTYARYRAIYSVEREELANGDVLLHYTITFIAVGKRAERDRNDIYRIAEKIVESGLIDIDRMHGEEEE